MKKLLLLLTGLGLHISCAQVPQDHFSKETLSYELQTLEGEKISFEKVLKMYEGRTIFIDVWASWCPDCLKSLPEVKHLQEKYPEVTFLFLSVDKTPESWAKGIEKYDVKGEHYLISDGMKGAFGKSITLDWIPRYMIVNKEGKLVLFKAIETTDEQIIEVLNQ